MSEQLLTEKRGEDLGATSVTLGTVPLPQGQKEKRKLRDQEMILVEKVRHGDERAYMQLIQRYQDRLYRKALSMVSNPDDAQDVLQEGLLSAFKAFPRFRGDSGVYTWLYRIVVNKAKDHLSRRRGKKETLTDYQETQVRDDRVNYQKNVELDEQSRFLLNLIDEMEPMYRDILKQRFFEEMSYQEISELGDINIGTVKSRLFKAKEILKKKIIQTGRRGDYLAL